MYDFTISGYEGDPTINYAFDVPGNDANVYIGLANWDSDSWSWFAGEPDNTIDVGTFEPYLAFGGKLLVTVLMVGTDPAQLREVRVGSIAPYAYIFPEAERGVAPWTVTYDAGFSQDEDGTIVEYRWDTEIDGDFATTTGTDPTYTVEYLDPGIETMYVKVTDDTNVYSIEGATVTVWEPRLYTYGSVDYNEEVRETTIDEEGNLIMWGTRTLAANGSVMRMKLDHQAPDNPGEITVTIWDGAQHDALYAACDGPSGGVYTCGTTESFGAGGKDGLLQYWDSDGNLVSSWAIGLPGTDEEFHAVQFDAGWVYLAGTQFDPSTLLTTGLLLKAQGGVVVWCKEYKSVKSVSLTDLLQDETHLYACGAYTPTASDFDALYISVSKEDGSLAGGGFFGNSTDDERAVSMLMGDDRMPGLWLTGTINTGGVDHSFVVQRDGHGAEIGADFSEQLNAVALVQSEQAPLTVVLARRQTFADSTVVLADLDNTLAVMPTSKEFQSTATAASYPMQAMAFGANGILTTGSHFGQVVVAIEPGINAVPTTRMWRNLSIEVEHHPTLPSQATNLTTSTPGEGFGALGNRQGDSDAIFHLRNYNDIGAT